MTTPRFKAATPVWAAGRAHEMNVRLGLVAAFDHADGPVICRIAGVSVYRIFVNGSFAAFGPARAAKGFYRVDEWDLTAHVSEGRNVIAIEAAGYNCHSFYLVKEPAFVCAEVESDGAIVARTGEHFVGRALRHVLRKVPRFTFQRTFGECSRHAPTSDAWRTDATGGDVALAAQAGGAWLPRRVPYPSFATMNAARLVTRVQFDLGAMPDLPWHYSGIHEVEQHGLGGFPLDELESRPFEDAQRLAPRTIARVNEPASRPFDLPHLGGLVFDLGRNVSGFVGLRVRCDVPTRLLVIFDELQTADGLVDFRRSSGLDMLEYRFEPGAYAVESFEPYTMRYAQVVAVEGACTVEAVYARLYENAEAHRAAFASSDRVLNELFEAARATYAQNAVDLFTDCPGRERGGWLCDSYFTAFASVDLTGTTALEHAFLENFLLAPRQPQHPAAIVPMVYPSDRDAFIPQWSLWFVYALPDFLARGGDARLVRDLEPKVRALLAYFESFRNTDGLLENLEGNNFVEWSRANELLKDVNYPTQMLYAATLDRASTLYAEPRWADEARRVRATTLAQSFDGEWFVDNATRDGDALTPTGERSETCQYYAFFFGTATPRSHPDAWRRLVEELGPDRAARHPALHEMNAFIGQVLRFELLLRHGETRRMIDEARHVFEPMARLTGTLWEHLKPEASCNHGFASIVAHWWLRDVVGLKAIDRVNRRVTVRPGVESGVDFASGSVPVGGGTLAFRWWREAGEVRHAAEVPAGWSVAEASERLPPSPLYPGERAGGRG